MGEPPLRVPFERVSPSLSVSVYGKRDFAIQRQRRRKGPRRSTDRQQRQSTRTKTHQFDAIRTAPGKSLFVWDCVVADAVAVEPVSAWKFPPNREKYREFCSNERNSRAVAIKKSRQVGTLDEIPCATEQGILGDVTGKHFRKLGIYPNLAFGHV
jgi:hypothetical protein